MRKGRAEWSPRSCVGAREGGAGGCPDQGGSPTDGEPEVVLGRPQLEADGGVEPEGAVVVDLHLERHLRRTAPLRLEAHLVQRRSTDALAAQVRAHREPVHTCRRFLDAQPERPHHGRALLDHQRHVVWPGGRGGARALTEGVFEDGDDGGSVGVGCLAHDRWVGTGSRWRRALGGANELHVMLGVVEGGTLRLGEAASGVGRPRRDEQDARPPALRHHGESPAEQRRPGALPSRRRVDGASELGLGAEDVDPAEAHQGAALPREEVVHVRGRALPQHAPFKLETSAVVGDDTPLEVRDLLELAGGQPAGLVDLASWHRRDRIEQPPRPCAGRDVLRAPNLKVVAEERPSQSRPRETDAGIEIRPVFGPADLEGWDPEEKLGEPGRYPYTRGIHAEMYRRRLWTMRQYAGFGTAEATNERFKFLLAHGQTGLSCAFDLPTQMGFDSDHPRAEGEVGKVGVAIDSLVDMRLLLADLPLDSVTTSMTINATAAVLLLLYELVAEEQGIRGDRLGGTIQNDILKEYIARGTYIYPPRPSMRLIVDTFSYCREQLPRWNPISISGYHIREAGSTAVQEVAFTLADGIAYVDAALAAGLDVDEFAPRLSFFFNAHNNLFEEVAKFRAARRMWARIMTERFGARDERSKLLRFHTQTGGSTLTAQQPDTNIVRVAVQALAAALGGTQSLHTNGFDEALGLPTERAAKLALRTQQIIGHESGVTDTVDPLGGSYFVEYLTDEIERGAWAYLERVDALGGAVAAIEAHFPQEEIEAAAYAYAKAVDDGEKVVVGVNRFADEGGEPTEVFPIDPELQRTQVERLAKLRAERDQAAVDAALADVRAAATGTQNLLVPMKEALRRMATLGEVSDALRAQWGVYAPGG